VPACRQQGDKIGSTFSAVSAAVKVINHQSQLEKLELEKSQQEGMTSAQQAEREAAHQAESLRLMLDAMWASNAVDIQATVSRACNQVRACLRDPVRSCCSMGKPGAHHILTRLA
jgi:X-domain of DnaJ-containing